jgi:hypothetical protein
MKPMQGYYSIIQYCPDLGRLEAANVGVLLFCPETGFLKALMTGNNSRIIRFFGSEGHDWKRINVLKRGIAERLSKEKSDIKTIDDLRQFIALRANLMQITSPNSIRVVDAEQDLHELFEQIIGESSCKAHRTSLRKYVGQKLLAPDIREKVAQDVEVEVPILQKQIAFPYGYQNGRFNLINPVRFSAKDSDQSVATACKYAVEGRELYDHPHSRLGELQLVIVGQFRPNDSETPSRVRRVFEEYLVKLYKADELQTLVDEIRRTGKKLTAP